MSGFTTSLRVGDRDGQVAVVQLRGQLDGAAAPTMAEVYAAAIDERVRALVLDFGGVDYINSTGIALVVGLLGKARSDRVEVRVCGLSDHYRHIFEITRLADFLTFFADEPAAVAAARS
jgi:anti-anti-sigma factor